YILHYSYDGYDYEQLLETADYPDLSLSEAWIDPYDPDEFATSNSGEMKNISWKILLVSVISFVIWLIMYNKAETRPYNENVANDVFIYSMIWDAVSIFSVLLCSIIVHSNPGFISNSLLGFSLILFVCFTAIAVMAKREEKRCHRRR
ncbi:MAG: hypothetical protein K6G84_03570, partial [Lachnospiraceae bacterium]|nr:hypothetical protein [Lachnospiraceae bacterium]